MENEQQFLVIQITETADGRYNYTCGPGISVNEIAFSLAGFAKVLVKEKFIKRPSEFTTMLRKYINSHDTNEKVEENE